MNISFLDCDVINPGDISWNALHSLGKAAIYPNSGEHEIIERTKDAEAILIVRSPITCDLIKASPNLRYIGVFATGYDTIDIAAANKAGIVVANVPAYSTTSVAQGTMALMLELTNHVGLHSDSVHAGQWSDSKHFGYWKKQILELSGLTLGLVGFGAIGRRVAKIAHAYDMNIIACTQRGTIQDIGVPVQSVDRATVFKEADILSLHCPLSPTTRHLINEDNLSLMKPTSLLVNTSRGGVVDEWALAKALCECKIAGAALDVMALEPPSRHNPLLHVPNCIITPHNTWSARQTRERLVHAGIETLAAFMRGEPKNIVNRPVHPNARPKLIDAFRAKA